MPKRRLVIATLAVFLFFWLVLGSQAALTDGLVAWYPFTGNANDASGNGNNGTVFGATLAADRFGNAGSAYSFDGINDYINIGSRVKPAFPITVSAWIRLDGLVAGQFSWVISNDYVNSGSSRYGVSTSIYGDGRLVSWAFNGLSSANRRYDKVTDSALATVGGWHHYAVVFNAFNEQHIYWDGIERSGTYNGTGTGMSYSNSGEGAIGMFYADINSPVFFKGAMDDVRVYGRSLSQSEIQQLSSVPLPAAGWLLASGAVGLIALRRKLRS